MKMLCRNFNCSHRIEWRHQLDARFLASNRMIESNEFLHRTVGSADSLQVQQTLHAAKKHRGQVYVRESTPRFAMLPQNESRKSSSSISEGFPLHWLARKSRFFSQNFLFPFECERRILRGATFGECGPHQSRLSPLVRYRWSSIFWRLELEWKTNLEWKTRAEFRLNFERCSRMFYFYSSANRFQA